MVMLHLELYQGRREPPWWEKEQSCPAGLVDPLPYLPAAPSFVLEHYDGRFAVDPAAPRCPSRWWAAWGGTP